MLFLQNISGYTSADIVAGRADQAIDATLALVAIPGYSKHESGFTLDLKAGPEEPIFASSAVGQWMAADNYRVPKELGFIPSYPPGTGPQGPIPEPWEYIYVGGQAIDCSLHLARDNDRAGFDRCVAAATG